MIAHVRAKVERAGLADRIEVRKVEPDPMPLPDVSTDIVFSKDSIVHIPDKEPPRRPLRDAWTTPSISPYRAHDALANIMSPSPPAPQPRPHSPSRFAKAVCPA